MKRAYFVSFFAAFAAVLVLGLAGCNQPNSNNTASSDGAGDVASLAGKVWKLQIATPPGQPQGQGQDTEPDSYVVIDLETSTLHRAYKTDNGFFKLSDKDEPFKLKNKQIMFDPDNNVAVPVTIKKSGTNVELYMSVEGYEVKIATLSPAESNITVEQIKNAKQKGE